jgi:tRNA G10  N-methylase Trm11
MSLILGDCLEQLKLLGENSVHGMVTDPPAGISFMNKEWDTGENFIPWLTEVMKECLRVLKPGAHALVWAIPRTSHWTATAVENAGFEIRDVVTHLFGSGFPKSLDISKAIDKQAGAEREIIGENPNSRPNCAGNQMNTMSGPITQSFITAPATDDAKKWQGFGTALKPAAEFWVLARKPLSEKTVASNVLKHGTGGLNIDASRIGTDIISTHGGGDKLSGMKGNGNSGVGEYKTHQGRFPANLVLSKEVTPILDAQAGQDVSRFFYVAKASTSEKNKGLETNEAVTVDDGRDKSIDNPFQRGETLRKNSHPTVKAVKLMRYLCRLITPPGGLILDPFMGSGSTGIAAREEGFQFIGIEKDKEYFEIARARIEGKP